VSPIQVRRKETDERAEGTETVKRTWKVPRKRKGTQLGKTFSPNVSRLQKLVPKRDCETHQKKRGWVRGRSCDQETVLVCPRGKAPDKDPKTNGGRGGKRGDKEKGGARAKGGLCHEVRGEVNKHQFGKNLSAKEGGWGCASQEGKMG